MVPWLILVPTHSSINTIAGPYKPFNLKLLIASMEPFLALLLFEGETNDKIVRLAYVLIQIVPRSTTSSGVNV